MPSARYVYFTKADEAALSRELAAKYPNVRFLEDKDWPTADVEFLPSVDAAKAWTVYLFAPEAGWEPEIGPSRNKSGYRVQNLPEKIGILMRSSNGWGEKECTPDGEPRWIEQGTLHIPYTPPCPKGQAEYMRVLWRIFDRIATWRLKPYKRQPRVALNWEKTDKRVWAGHDAVRWAREHPLRMFTGGNGPFYRPLETDETYRR